MSKYKTRDPKPTNRDPQPEPPSGEPERSFDHVPIVRVARPVCPACGGSTWRSGGTTRPNIPTGEMLRWRRCSHCGRSQYHASPMTDGEKRQFAIAPV